MRAGSERGSGIDAKGNAGSRDRTFEMARINKEAAEMQRLEPGQVFGQPVARRQKLYDQRRCLDPGRFRCQRKALAYRRPVVVCVGIAFDPPRNTVIAK